MPTLELNDTFENDAEIYFDFNFPIITNNELTTVSESLSVDEYDLANVSVYPNPVQDVFHVKTTQSISSIAIYNIQGKTIKTVEILGSNTSETQIDVSSLSDGVYFVKVRSETAENTYKNCQELGISS